MPIRAGQSFNYILICLPLLLSLTCGQRRVGLHGFQVNDTLWLDGGRYVNSDGSTSITVPTLGSIDLTIDFNIPQGPIIRQQPRPSVVPTVSHGVMWSNLIDRAWLFGGKSEADSQLTNTLWRFEPGESQGQWTCLNTGRNVSDRRPSNGAGCNVPDLQTGYYLGGMIVSDDAVLSGPKFLHTLTIFDMETESLSSLEVPDMVPVVNQSLVFLNTGNRDGLLVALGGFTEKNGSLAVSPLSSVFIYDISSHIWMEQKVTDENGHSVEDEKLGFEPSVAIPRKRFNTCATAGSAQDKTSHNIFILGGENETHSMQDAWLLSFPSAIWMKIPLPDTTNGPKSENSCLLLNSRYVLMFGGCYQDQNPYRPCMSYSYDPLLYDVTKPGWQDYTYHINGYFVPQNISDIIGGDDLGGSPHSSPMFGTFGDPRLRDLFRPPYHRRRQGRFYYNALVVLTLPALLCLPFLVTLIYVGANLRPSTKIRKPKGNNWKPWPMQYPYLLFVNVTTIALIATVVFLCKMSGCPDPDPEHWTGGLESAGTWTGKRFASRFIRAAGSGLPPQGLLSTYYDQGTSGQYSQKNFTKRLSGFAYWAITYMPMLIAVIYGRIWKVLDDEVKRIDKYYRLFDQDGCTGNSSLCLNYHSFWTPLAIVQAFRYRHWTVLLSSTGSVLASTVLPVIQNYVLIWELYSGGSLAWPDSYSWQVAIADPFWSKVLASLLSVTLLCSLGLLILIRGRTTGLIENPAGIASIHELILTNNHVSLQLNEDADRQTFSELCSDIGSICFRLRRSTDAGHMTLEASSPLTSTIWLLNAMKNCVPFKKTILKRFSKLKPVLDVLKRSIHSITNYFITDSQYFLFRKAVLNSWLLFLSTLLAFGISVVTIINRNAQAEQWNYGIPLSPNVYVIVGVSIQSIFDVVEHNVRSLTIFDTLRNGYQPPRTLWEDYTCGIPVHEIWVAYWNSHYLLCFVLLGSLATVVYITFLGSLQLSSSEYGATSFNSDLTAATASTILVAFILLVNLAVRWRYGRHRFLLRPPDTLAALIPCIIFSPGLREDFEEVKGEQGVEAKIRKLEQLDRRYALGVFKDEHGKERLGIERHYHDGLRGWSNVDLRRRMESL